MSSYSGGGSNRPKLRSRIAQAMHYVDEATGAVVPPMIASSTFARDETMELRDGYVYSRYGSPTSDLLEKIICELEDGADCLTFGAGLAAFAAVFETVNSGDHIVAPQLMYHGGLTWLRRICKKRKIDLTLFDPGKPETLKQAVEAGRTKIVWIETPTNPTWEITDIAAAARIAHDAGAILGVDCTCASPVTTQALTGGRYCLSFGHQISQRSFRCYRRCADHPAKDRHVGRHNGGAQIFRHNPCSL